MISPARQETWKIPLCAALMICATARCTGAAPADHRSIPLSQESAGVFIGIEKFSYDFSLENVRFAVNDAVDFAYALSIERGLLPANRVLLLLAGEPGEGSQERLEQLLASGARRESARQADIYSLVEEQSKLAGKGGILVISIATHGFSSGSDHLLLAEDSLFEYRTGITAANLLQATQPGSGDRRILFVDACQTNLFATRSGPSEPDIRSAMRKERIGALATIPGYVVFSAASIGQYALSSGRNGRFTGAILAGLHCQRSAQGREAETFQQLASFVREEVTKQSEGLQTPELRMGGGSVDFVFPPCRVVIPRSFSLVPAEVLLKIESAGNLFAVGGMDNIETSFQRYQEAFHELPPEIRATLNQGLVAKVAKLREDSQRAEGIRLYQQLLDPLAAQSRATPD